MLLKSLQKKEGPKNFLAAPFLIPSSQLSAVKKGIKNGADRKFFGPSYFVTASTKMCSIEKVGYFEIEMKLAFIVFDLLGLLRRARTLN